MYTRIAANMEALMPSLVAFSNSCANLNTEGLSAGTDAITALVTASEGIPESGGVLGWLVGDNDWTTFGAGLADLGDALKSFSESCAGIDEEGLQAGCDATTELAKASEYIPNSGGKLAEWIGDKNWSRMKDGRVDYGDA